MTTYSEFSSELTERAHQNGWVTVAEEGTGTYTVSSTLHSEQLKVTVEPETNTCIINSTFQATPTSCHIAELGATLQKLKQEAEKQSKSRQENDGEDNTTGEQLVEVRRKQDLYRARLLEMWGGRCAITGVSCPDLLRASHAKPWKDADDHERLDPYNGFLLEARFDALFDQGYISFNDEGSLIISPQLPHEDQLALGLIPTPLALKKLHPKHLPYLQWHRGHVFKG